MQRDRRKEHELDLMVSSEPSSSSDMIVVSTSAPESNLKARRSKKNGKEALLPSQ